MLRINLFSWGNPESFRTWSNIPSFVSGILKSKGHCVNTVNINPMTSRRYTLFDILFFSVYRRIYLLITRKQTFASYNLTCFNRRKIVKTVKSSCVNSDVDLFFSFSYGKRTKSQNKLVLFHDWNKEWEIKNLHSRSLDIFELAFARRERNLLKSADLIFCLFPRFVDYLLEIGVDKHKIVYLGAHVNIPLEKIPPKIDIVKKQKSKRILFIGNRKFYLSGLLNLLEANNILNNEYHIDIIGFSATDIDQEYCNVTFHGYLNKEVLSERDKFYDLMSIATIFVNTTPSWGAFSSACEALYFGTPLIIAGYDEFAQVFPENERFSFLLKEQNPKILATHIHDLMSNESLYLKMAKSAHKSVQYKTWDYLGDKICNHINLI